MDRDDFHRHVDGPFDFRGSFNSCGLFFIYIHCDCGNSENMSSWYLKQEGISFLSCVSARGDNLAKE